MIKIHNHSTEDLAIIDILEAEKDLDNGRIHKYKDSKTFDAYLHTFYK